MLRRELFNFNLHSSHEYTLKYFGREEIEQEGYYCIVILKNLQMFVILQSLFKVMKVQIKLYYML